MPIGYKQLQVAVDVKCPYFCNVNSGKGKTGYSITCEGISTAQYNTTRFLSNNIREAYIQGYCNKYPNECPIAKAIEEKYLE